MGPQGPQGATGAQGPQGPAGPGHTLILKAADESLNSTTTLQDDDHLTYALQANEHVEFEAFILTTQAHNNADIKYTFAVPTGATILWTASKQLTTSATVTQEIPVTASGTTRVNDFAAGDLILTRVRGYVRNGSTAGSLTLRWAQNSSNGSNITVKQDSFLKIGKF
ncbi:MAG: hypothetical protein HBSAPP03_27400 [Phycisphaerae bacterium]|nr:MAG: hypothetical protein HBSAPP03_27400 [Phycisphaerae bacterium]